VRRRRLIGARGADAARVPRSSPARRDAGIRPVENRPADDQKRTVDVAQAFNNGADYIVVGRPIRDAADPRAAAEAIQQTIAGVFAGPGK
jgi:hypothetical protein